jgi:hypothetical protein
MARVFLPEPQVYTLVPGSNTQLAFQETLLTLPDCFHG